MKKLNFLLVMPRFVEPGEYYVFPSGIPYISAVMKQAGFNVFALNLNHIKGEAGDIVNKEIEKNNIDVLMTGGLSAFYSRINSFLDPARKKNPLLKIIVGGGIITADPEISMRAFGNIDIGVVGEGEETVIELCNALQCDNNLDNIAGIIYLKNGNLVQAKPRKEIEDIDSLPFPDYEGFGIEEYLKLKPSTLLGAGKAKEITIVASRSCPYQCTFCFHTTGKKYRRRSIDNVLNEIKYLKEKYNIESVSPQDELFSINKDYIKKFSDALRELNITWNATFRVDDVNEENIEIIKDSTCYVVKIGIESADNKILKSMKKKITIEQTEQAISIISKAKLPVFGNIILGDIAETFETANNSIDWWKRYKEHNFGLYFIETFPGTFNYKYAVKNGIIKDPIRYLQDGCPTVNLSKMSEDELSIIVKEVMLLPIKEANKLKEQKIIKYYKNSMADFSGTCSKCGNKGIYRNILFHIRTSNQLSCNNCGTIFIPDISQEIKEKIIKNLKKESLGKIAIWGVLPYIIDIFDGNKEFSIENLIFIDTSSFNRRITINGNKIHSHEILANGDIDTTVCCYRSARLITEKLYPKIRKTIDFGDLLCEDEI